MAPLGRVDRGTLQRPRIATPSYAQPGPNGGHGVSAPSHAVQVKKSGLGSVESVTGT